jgi:hypothetical protein
MISPENELATDLLLGARAIAHYIGLQERQVFHLHKQGALPTFKLGNLIAARKSELGARLTAERDGRAA